MAGVVYGDSGTKRLSLNDIIVEDDGVSSDPQLNSNNYGKV